MDDSTWIAEHSRHPDNCSEYDVIFADDVAARLAQKEAELKELQERYRLVLSEGVSDE
jgi:hypothetical protein